MADDATAASWNPGALIQLERPELSVVGSFLSTQQDFDPGSTGWSLGDEAVSRGDLNYASVAYPFRVFRKNFVAALNYQQIYDFHMNLDFKQTSEDRTPPALSYTQNIDFKSKGGNRGIDTCTFHAGRAETICRRGYKFLYGRIFRELCMETVNQVSRKR